MYLWVAHQGSWGEHFLDLPWFDPEPKARLGSPMASRFVMAAGGTLDGIRNICAFGQFHRH